MAHRTTDNGTHGTQHRPVPGDSPTARTADVSPPGSRERAEAHVTGWSPEKEAETAELRQGPFHRAATQRLYNPSGGRNAGDVGPPQASGVPYHGPQDMEDREDARSIRQARAQTRPGLYPPGYRERADESLRWGDTARTMREDPGQGPSRSSRARHAEPDMRGEAVSAEYRATRGGEGPGDERWAERSPERLGGRGVRDERSTMRPLHAEDEGYDAMMGLDTASPGIPGRSVGPGDLRGPRGEMRETGRTGERRRWAREPLTAREIMTRGVKSVRRDSPLREVAQLMKDEDCGVVPIVDERGTLLGLVTDRDLVIRAFTGGRTPDALRAGDVMTDDVQAVTPEEDIHSIIDLMGRRQVRRVPVVDRDDRLLGIISMGDIANRADYDEELQEALDRVSARRSFWSRL